MEIIVQELFEEYEMSGLKINLYQKLSTWVVEQKPKILEDKKGYIRGCEDFRYLEEKIKRTDKKMILRIG